MAISLGRRLPDGSSGVPGPSAGRVNGTCFALHRTGFGKPAMSPRLLVGSYPTVSPLPTVVLWAVSSLFHFPSAFAAWGFPSVLPCGVRTFLERPKALATIRPAALR
jgi:hypothetical protein